MAVRNEVLPAGRAAIDRLRDSNGGLDREALLSVLPYGKDFLFVDAVTVLETDHLEATYRVPAESSYIRAHFEEMPVMPGALLAEGWSQAGTLLVRYNLEEPESKVILGMQIERTRFDAPAFPGETLHYSVRLRALDSRAARLEGEARTAERRIARLQVVVGILDVETFRSMAP